ncbi:MAG: hypothetical protein KDK70_29825, partial [Myxococcales bacterium]|nr:hypothetical protein [Myxococcales bacterium]
LVPRDLIAVLTAELRGEAGIELLTDDEVRQMVGEQRWSALAADVMSQPPEVSSYLQLRLASVMTDVPVTLRSRTGPGELDVWLAQSLETTGDHAWRMLAWAGELAAAELALGTRWRPRPAPRPEPVADAPAKGDASKSGESSKGKGSAGKGSKGKIGAGKIGQGRGGAVEPESEPEPAALPVVRGVSPADHWTSALVPTADNLWVLLLEGRLRQLAGQHRKGLDIHRYTAARAVEGAVSGADRQIAQEAAWHLAHGRPWHALAVATVGEGPHAERVAAAAATALRLTEAFCGGPCKDDRDRDRVERALGEAWVQEQQAQWVDRSHGRTRSREPVEACPSLGELLAPDATGRLAEALGEARRDAAPAGHGRRLREAIEGDLGLGCAGRYVLPLMLRGHHGAHAEALAALLSHDAALDAPRALTVHAALAMIAGQEQQASLLATAAGSASPDPAATWRELACYAHAAGQRELALRSLREALMHTPRLDDPSLHRALLLAGLAGIDTDWNLREAAAGQAEPAAHVRDLVERVEPVRRFAAREELARALSEQPWLDADARQRLEPALWPEPDVAQAHGIGRAWMGLRSGRPPDLQPADVGPLDLASQELLVALRAQPGILPATEAFVEPPRMEALRLMVARQSGEWVRRWRTAIGLATWGTPRSRAQAMAVLLEMASAEQRQALVAVLLEAPAAVEPSEEGPAEAPLLATPEDELAVVYALPLDPLGL